MQLEPMSVSLNMFLLLCARSGVKSESFVQVVRSMFLQSGLLSKPETVCIYPHISL